MQQTLGARSGGLPPPNEQGKEIQRADADKPRREPLIGEILQKRASLRYECLVTELRNGAHDILIDTRCFLLEPQSITHLWSELICPGSCLRIARKTI